MRKRKTKQKRERYEPENANGPDSKPLEIILADLITLIIITRLALIALVTPHNSRGPFALIHIGYEGVAPIAPALRIGRDHTHKLICLEHSDCISIKVFKVIKIIKVIRVTGLSGLI